MFNLFKKKQKEVQNVRMNDIAPTFYNSGVRFDFSNIPTAGENVTETSVMGITAVYACVRLIAGGISTMPVQVLERRNGVSVANPSHDYWYLFNEQPTGNYSAATFFESLVSSVLLHGDGFARLRRRNKYSTTVDSVEWIHSSRVTPFYLEDYSLAYRVVEIDGQISAELAADMIHVPGLGFDGLNGMSPIRYSLRPSAGTALAANTYAASFYENGCRPDYTISFPEQTRLSADEVEQLKAMIKAKHAGAKNAFNPLFLQKGGKLEAISISQADAKTLETRKYQDSTIAQFFGVPPHLIGADSSSTTWGTGVEQMNTAYVQHTLMPILVKIEQELTRKLWPISTRYHIGFDASGLLRGDFSARMQAYRVGLGRAGEPGIFTVNEVRAWEQLPPIEGGDKLITGEFNTGFTNDKTN